MLERAGDPAQLKKIKLIVPLWPVDSVGVAKRDLFFGWNRIGSNRMCNRSIIAFGINSYFSNR
jgi:hypothetical protein